MLFRPKLGKGFTIIEIMFTLMVIAAIAVLAFSRSQQSSLKTNAEVIRGSVLSLMNGLNNYYQENCQDLSSLKLSTSSSQEPITVLNLSDYGVVASNISNPYAPSSSNAGRDSYLMYIEQKEDNPGPQKAQYSVLEVEVAFKKKIDNNVWNSLVGLLNPDETTSITGSTSYRYMRWNKLPTSQSFSGLSSLSAYYQLHSKDVYTDDASYKPSGAGQPCSSRELGVD